MFYPGSESLKFSSRIPDPGGKNTRSRILLYIKKRVEKNSSRIRIPDLGGKKAPEPGSGSATLAL
jgi:hypothetical protein